MDPLRLTRSTASAAALAFAFIVPGSAFAGPPLTLGFARETAGWRGVSARGETSPALTALTSDTLTFRPSIQYEYWDSTGHEPLDVAPTRVNYQVETEWLRAPMGDHLLDHPDPWITDHPGRWQEFNLVLDYNRSDLVRYGAHYQAQRPLTMYPRIGAKLEYATGRKRTLYGVQI